MNERFPDRLRAAALRCLPAGCMLRRDRGRALYVSDAPRRDPNGAWLSALAGADFICETNAGLVRISPGPAWLSALASDYPEPPDFLCATLQRFDGPADPEAIALFAEGVKALESRSGSEAYARALRQRAAVCLRKGGGGGLYACALLNDLIEKERSL